MGSKNMLQPAQHVELTLSKAMIKLCYLPQLTVEVTHHLKRVRAQQLMLVSIEQGHV